MEERELDTMPKTAEVALYAQWDEQLLSIVRANFMQNMGQNERKLFSTADRALC